MEKVITEKSPLTDDDFFYLVDRNKESFTYPLHKHEEMELNFVEHCEGARRIVGDSIETLGRYDLVLLGSGLEHNWSQHNCESNSIHEITIQFSRELMGEQFLAKNQLTAGNYTPGKGFTFFHSVGDEIVPFCNFESVRNNWGIGDIVALSYQSNTTLHLATGIAFYLYYCGDLVDEILDDKWAPREETVGHGLW